MVNLTKIGKIVMLLLMNMTGYSLMVLVKLSLKQSKNIVKQHRSLAFQEVNSQLKRLSV
jgi:hypothetical protein